MLLTWHHAKPLVTRRCFLFTRFTYGRPWHVLGHQVIYGECYRFAFFHNHFNLKVSRASCCSSKHSPDATACLNHTAIRKFYVHGRALFKHEKYLDLLVTVKSFVLRQSSSYLITSYVISSHLINNLKIFLDLFEKNQSITLF